jgi:ketosteroid isomerase-like protein
MTVTSTALELVQSMYAAFGRGDVGYLLEQLSPDCQWVAPGEGVPSAGTYVGAGAEAFFEKLATSEEFTAFEPREFFVKGDDVIALGHEACKSKLTGKTAATNFAMLFRVREGKVYYFEVFYDTAAYLRMHQG